MDNQDEIMAELSTISTTVISHTKRIDEQAAEIARLKEKLNNLELEKNKSSKENNYGGEEYEQHLQAKVNGLTRRILVNDSSDKLSDLMISTIVSDLPSKAEATWYHNK